MSATVAPLRRAVTGRTQIPTVAVANTNSYTDAQASTIYHPLMAVTDLSIVIGNLFRSTPDVLMNTLPTFVGSYGLWDTASNTLIGQFTFSGASTVSVAGGQIIESDPITVSRSAYQAFEIRRLHRYATAPANFPANHHVIGAGREINEWGNGITDKTVSGSLTFARPLGSFDPIPLLAVKGTAPGGNTKVVCISGDSISSDNSNDTNLPMYTGYANIGLTDANIPTINIGISGQSLNGLLNTTNSATNMAIYKQLMQIAGVTYLYCPLDSNDWASGQTDTQLYNNQLVLKAILDPIGVKLVPATAQPRTNSGNTTYNGTETNTFTRRAAYNATIKSNNGVGYGYYDLAAVTQDATNNNLWRSDVLTVTAVPTLNAGGGPSYAQSDELEFGTGGTRIQISVTSGVATAASSIRRPGGYTTATFPSGAVAPTRMWRGGVYNISGATGATFTFASAAATPTADGIHPNPPVHGVIARDFSTWAAANFP